MHSTESSTILKDNFQNTAKCSLHIQCHKLKPFDKQKVTVCQKEALFIHNSIKLQTKYKLSCQSTVRPRDGRKFGLNSG